MSSVPGNRGTTAASRFRRTLRTRLVLAFGLLGLLLITSFIFTTYWFSTLLDADTRGFLQSSVNRSADAFYRNPRSPFAELSNLRAYRYPPNQPELLFNPDWAMYSNGVYHVSSIDENGHEFNYRLAVRKDPQQWFFIAMDQTQAIKTQRRVTAILFAMGLTALFLTLLVGWWLANTVMRPVTELAADLKKSSRSPDAKFKTDRVPNDEVGQLAQALDDYSDRLREVVQRDQEFNADVSHELRTPLAVIRGATELLLTTPNLDDRTRTRIKRIQRSEQQCTDLISSMLLLSRNERGTGSVDVAKLCEQLIDAHREQVGRKPVVLRFEGEPGLVVNAPESSVSVALGNLIGNAVKYTQEGEVLVRLEGDIVRVIDNGPGLSVDDMSKLFQRGYRGTHVGHSQGGGIGLSIVRRLCALYGWEVSVLPHTPRGVEASLYFDPNKTRPTPTGA